MTATTESIELAIIAARAATEKKAQQIVALDVSEQLYLTDVFLVISGSNERQVGAIVDEIDRALHTTTATRLRREGNEANRWVLLDYGDIVIHVQHQEDREYYALERLWKDCPVVELPEDAQGVEDADISEYEFDEFGFPVLPEFE